MKAKLQLLRSVYEGQIRTALHAHWHASAAGDTDAEHDIYDDDVICDYPQSGERMLGRKKLQALRSHHPGKPSGFEAQASLAASQNKQGVLHDLLQRGFESANHILVEQQRTGEIHFFAGLGPLVQVGMQNEPELTTSFIDSLPASYLKADVLLGTVQH
jgi:hypothetical protein